MKKFLLVSLTTMLFAVTAWGTNVANKTELQNALNAGGDITLTANIALGNSKVTMTSGTVILDLNGHDLTGTIANYGTDKGVLNVSGGTLTINATGGGKIDNTASNGCGIVTSGGAKITINGGSFHGGYEAVYIKGAEVVVNGGTFTTTSDNCMWIAENDDNHSKVLVKGGTFTGGWMCFQVDATSELKIENITAIKGTVGSAGIIYNAGGTTIEITGGSFKGENPAQFVLFDEALMTYNNSTDTYVVSNEVSGVAYNMDLFTTGESLQDVVDAASNGNHILILASGQSATVGKNLTFELGANSANITAASGYQKSVNGDFVSVMAEGSLGAYLNGTSETPFVVSANTDLRSQGLVMVKGTKKITINSGVTVTTAYKTKYTHFRIPNGAKLTIEGNGTITGDRGQFLIEKGGELVIGKADQSDQLHINTSFNTVVNSVVKNYGKTTINNAEIHAASAVAQDYSVMNILGGLYTGEASTASMHKYCITAENGSQTTLKNSIVKGVHGTICVQGLDATQKSGNIRIENCELIATDTPNGKKINGGVHYALYSATGGIASVYNTKMKSTSQDRAIHIGNNDAYNTFGLVYVYEGCMVKAPTGKRIWVQKRTATDKEVLFPISIDENSDWYKAAMNGGEGPLPAGYVWKEIINAGEPTENQVLDATAYADGYRWISVSTIEKAQDATGATTSWQQATTWVETPTGDDVPDENTAVIIPEGKAVVVSNAVADVAVGGSVVEAEQLVLGGEGASLTVQTGTTLNVGDGGVNIANGGKIIVEPGAVVTVGSAGLITTDEDALIIETTDDNQGVFLLQPEVTENTQPSATVKLKTKSRQIGSSSFVFERFAIPTIDGEATTYSIEGGAPSSSELYGGAASFLQAVWEWSGSAWSQLARFKDMEPFRGYQLTNNSKDGGLVYVFEGNLVGNRNMTYEFVHNGFDFYGNSYTADINIASFLSSFAAGIEKTVWLYDPYDKNFKTITSRLAGKVKYGNGEAINDIRSMQAFLMYLSDGTSASTTVDYASAIWGNPKYTGVSTPAPARESSYSENWVTIRVASESGLRDEIILVESDEFSNEFDDGMEAHKFMNSENINLYATTNLGDLAVVATNNLSNTILTFAAAEATEYTLTFADIEGEEFTLRDNVTGTTVKMTEGATYTFQQAANTTVPARFEIIGAPKVTTAIENASLDAAAKGIYSVTGQFLGHDFTNLPAGVYIVNGVKVVK